MIVESENNLETESEKKFQVMMTESINRVTEFIGNSSTMNSYITRGKLHAQIGHEKDAQKDFEKAIKLGENSTDMTKECSASKILIEKLSYLIEHKSRMLEDFESELYSERLYVERGRLFAKTGDKENASKDFLQVIKIRGSIYNEFERTSKLKTEFHDKIKNGDAEEIINRIRMSYTPAAVLTPEILLFESSVDKEPESGKEDLRELNSQIELSSESFNAYKAYKRRANYFRNLGDSVNELADYNTIIDLSDQFEDDYLGSIYFNRGNLFYNSGKYEQALSDFSKVKIWNDLLIEKLYQMGVPKNELNIVETIDQQIESDNFLLTQLDYPRNEFDFLMIRCLLENAESYHQRYRIHVERDNKEQQSIDFKIAENEYAKSLCQKRYIRFIHLKRGVFYFESGNEEKVEDEFNNALEYSPFDELSCAHTIGNYFAGQDDLNNAWNVYKSVTNIIFFEVDYFKFLKWSKREVAPICQAILELGERFIQKKKYKMAFSCMESVEDLCNLKYLGPDCFDWGETRTQAGFLLKKIESDIELEKKNDELIEKNMQLEDVKLRMQKMVEQYSHTLSNTLIPETIYQVAEQLKDKIEYKQDALVLLRAYNAEVTIRHQAELLRARHAAETAVEFRQFILSDRLSLTSEERAVSIKDILNNATERVIARLLNQNYAKLEKPRQKLISKLGLSIEEIRNNFEEECFFNKRQSTLEWLNYNAYPIIIKEFSSTWDSVRLKQNRYAHALFQGYFTELIFNAFKYGVHFNHDFLELKFSEKLVKDVAYLTSAWSNSIGETKGTDLGRGQGLQSIAEDLRQLNDSVEEHTNLSINKGEQTFNIELSIRKDILIPNPPLPRGFGKQLIDKEDK
jgi:Tfp pilus assembly protein PilF